jgi:hypothetical protein
LTVKGEDTKKIDSLPKKLDSLPKKMDSLPKNLTDKSHQPPTKS